MPFLRLWRAARAPSALVGSRPAGSVDSAYRLDGLDGLRAVAIAMVLLVHLFPSVLPGGTIGVDMFFVLSGFVITRLLLAEYDRHGGMDRGRFYVRRFLRLAPPLFVVCAFVLGVGAVTDIPQFRGQWTAALFASTYTTNLVRAGESGDYSDLTLTMGHTWSLGIEEQFYLVWPAILALAMAGYGVLGTATHTRRRVLLLTTAALCVAPTALRVVLWDSDAAHRIYNGPDARADQLFVGCLLAVVLWCLREREALLHRLRLSARWASPIAAFLLGTLAVKFRVTAWGGDEYLKQAWYTVGFAIVASLTVVVVATLVLDHRHPLTWLLSLRPIAWFGRVLSYGIYLWHYPLMYLSAHVPLPYGDYGRAAFTVSAAIAAAYLSQVCLERPLHRWWRRRQARHNRHGPAGGGRPSRRRQVTEAAESTKAAHRMAAASDAAPARAAPEGGQLARAG